MRKRKHLIGATEVELRRRKGAWRAFSRATAPDPWPTWRLALASAREALRASEGLPRLRPLRDLAAYLTLPVETTTAYGELYHGGNRVLDWVLGEVVAVGLDVGAGVVPGNLVVIQRQAGPYGAPRLSASELGYDYGGAVVFAPCRLVEPPRRDMELKRRHRRCLEIERAHPEEDPIWEEPAGDALKAEMTEHIEQIRDIYLERRFQGRSRLHPPGRLRETLRKLGVQLGPNDDGGDLPDGVIAIVEEDL